MSEEKKIIVDEDWKSQVEAEKEELSRRGKSGPEKSSSAAGPDDMQFPPASFDMLVSMLVTQAMAALGQLPHPETGQRAFHPQQAKYFIDMIEVLAEKTEGNLSADEAEGIKQLLHQLRMAFVAQQTSSAGETPTGGLET